MVLAATIPWLQISAVFQVLLCAFLITLVLMHSGREAGMGGLGFTPHVAQNTTRQRPAIDGRTTRHAGHQVSMRIRKRIEEPFGWIKTIGGGRKLRYIGRQRNRAWFKITAAVYNLIRITALDTMPA